MNRRPFCSLYFALGEREECPAEACAFWEDGACTFERVNFEFESRPDVARWLLGIRRSLESARETQVPTRPSAVHAFLPPGMRD